ncbi:hypothetical protein CVIRNUC_009367 [Coccomyxa viridis]|uniref:Ribosomal protein S21 n=1 Tax=Coccomyxa viridis TaxID=1274662 RepID=A0AAV1IJK8_9CHLO|nr:hypothetical protein CVIRNUC_009367 [Coccomyxa viridis]
MMSTLSAFLPSVGLRPRHTCKHSLSSSNGTASKLYMKSSHAYHVEVLVGDDEPPENALKRFRWATKTSGLVQEARRRRYFENTQDEKKRRIKDGHMKKSKRYVPPPRYEEAVTTLEPAPFADLFGDSDNIFGQEQEAPQSGTRSAF